ncbi:MAG: sensor domain-containing diguanylate cyclase [Candidatus Hydrogenedentes bacterium]|nr:sensor domain-containing diguanylate cyclase [Candidatus Hydrogenedentota bacterium]
MRDKTGKDYAEREMAGTAPRGLSRFPGALVPIDSPIVFSHFAADVAKQIAADPGDRLCLITDPVTARMVDELDRCRALAEHTFVLGEIPSRWARASGVRSAHNDSGRQPEDAALLLFSTTASVAMVGRRIGDGAATQFQGGWTADRKSVDAVARVLLPGTELRELLAPPAADAFVRWIPQMTRLMTVFTRLVSAQQTAGNVGRDELFSVLDILKAIASRRRTHDVLYVFVEQVARVIQMDRCSVVRIWGRDDQGQVVASHDDANVRDLLIDLEKYPELRWSMDHFEKVVINDAQVDPLTRDCPGLKESGICALLVVPIVLLDANIGSLFLRGARRNDPFTPREIGFCEIVAEAASNALERAHLLERLQTANERLERLAVTDELTGLHNHRYFRERYAEEFDRARRYALPLSCIMFDIDNFKKINDRYGHLQGDEILREIAARTLRTTRRSDIVARYGGEEFIIIMPQTGAEGARAQAERVRESVEDGVYVGLPQDAKVTVSVGVAELQYQAMLDGEALIRAADSALYEAKRTGKNRVVVSTANGEQS